MLAPKGVRERFRPMRPSSLILWGSIHQITRWAFLRNTPIPGSSSPISSGIASVENVLPENYGSRDRVEFADTDSMNFGLPEYLPAGQPADHARKDG